MINNHQGYANQNQTETSPHICKDAAAPAAAKSLQSCPTLCDPIDSSPPGSPVPGILQARILEWVAFPSPMHEREKWKWSLSVESDSLWPPWTAAHQTCLSITNSQSLLKIMSIELVMPSNYLILCHPLLLLPSIFSSIRVFSNESVLRIMWPKYWSFSFSISTSNK